MRQQTIDIRLLTFGLLTFGLLSCDKPDIRLNNPNDALRPATEFVRNNYAYSLFSAAIEKAGLADELNGPGPYTVLAPADAAFYRIGVYSPEDFDRWSTDSLAKLVRYHVHKGKLVFDDIPNGTVNTTYTNEAGYELYISRVSLSDYSDYTQTTVNGAYIGSYATRRDVKLSNGVFHEISEVMKHSDVSLRQWLEEQKQYSILVAGFKHFGYWDLLTDDRQWTVIAVPDDVFEQRGITAESISGMNVNRVGKRLFGVYIFPIRFFYTDLNIYRYEIPYYVNGDTRGIYLPIVADETFSNGITTGNFFIDGVQYSGFFVTRTQGDVFLGANPGSFSQYDNLTRNGIVHEISDVMFLPEQVID